MSRHRSPGIPLALADVFLSGCRRTEKLESARVRLQKRESRQPSGQLATARSPRRGDASQTLTGLRSPNGKRTVPLHAEIAYWVCAHSYSDSPCGRRNESRVAAVEPGPIQSTGAWLSAREARVRTVARPLCHMPEF